MAASTWRMLTAVMWKNVIFKKRHLILTIAEIFFPCLVFILLLYLHIKVSKQEMDNSVEVPVHESTYFNVQDDTYFHGCIKANLKLAFTPNNTFTQNIMNKIVKAVSERTVGLPNISVSVIALRSRRAIIKYMLDVANDTRPWGYGIEFTTNKEEQKELKYVIHTYSDVITMVFPKKFYPGPMFSSKPYIDNCFVVIQRALDTALIETASKNKLPFSVYIQPFPYPKYTPQRTSGEIMELLNFAVVLSFCFSVVSIIKGVVDEKQSGGKELMKMNGLPNWMIWFGWLLYAELSIIFNSILITILLAQGYSNIDPVLLHSNKCIFCLVLFLFYNSVVFLIFIVCAWFSSSLVAVCFGLTIYLLSFSIGTSVLDDSSAPIYREHIGCLVPTLALSKSIKLFQEAESKGAGVNWETLFSCSVDNEICLGEILIIFLVDIVIYTVIVWYIDCVRPGPYGLAKPWYFLCKCYRKEKPIEEEAEKWEFFEEPPARLKPGLAIRNVKKVYSNGVMAIKNVNLDIYQGEITALLGHNGAGKTTLMSIISGMCMPTKGAVYSFTSNESYFNVFKSMTRFRKYLGLCPQENMHFPYFTVIEHLIFFGMIKGMTKKKATEKGIPVMELMRMTDKLNAKVNNLSGGMKRKISLAIALVGEPSVLILDEPTSGMDPESRRELWDTLLEMRESRTLIITTHFMEEADVLGDRIAIMEHGNVICYGTSMFLKNIFGAGYYLTILINEKADTNKLTKIITEEIPGSKLKRSYDQQVIYVLPIEMKGLFPDLFLALEDENVAQGILSIGVSFTTLEEVFLRVGRLGKHQLQPTKEELSKMELMDDISEDDDQSTNFRIGFGPPESRKIMFTNFNNPLGKMSAHTQKAVHEVLKNISSDSLAADAVIRYTGCRLYWRHFRILMWKKFTYTRRKYFITSLFGLISLAMAFFVIYAITTELVKKRIGEGDLTYSFTSYKDSKVMIGFTDEANDYVDIYKSLISSITKDITSLKNKPVTEALMKSASKDLTAYRLKHLVAADWDYTFNRAVVALFSTIPYHGPVISLNLVMNTLLKSYNGSMSIEITASKIEKDKLSSSCGLLMKTLAQSKWILTIPIGFMFLVANSIAYPFDERITGAKHVQLMTGVSPVVYWGTAYIIDCAVYIFFTLLIPIPFCIMEFYRGIHVYFKFKEMGVLLTLLIMFGVSCIPYAYIFSYFSKTYAGSVTAFILVNEVAVIIGMFSKIYYIVKKEKNLFDDISSYFFRLNPLYCLMSAGINYNVIIFDNGRCTFCKTEETKGCENNTFEEFFQFQKDMKWGLNDTLCFLAADTILYFIVIFIIDYGMLGFIFRSIETWKVGKPNYGPERDPDVEQLNVLVNEIKESKELAQKYSLVVDSLVKKYEKKNTAVKGVSFVVKRGECFGLLGVNGAGKSTTFGMLTGVVRPMYGNAFIDEYNLKNNRRNYLKQIGYCPQFDAINTLMTGLEMVQLFGYLRGLSEAETNLAADFWTSLLGLSDFRDKLCGTYSGGNKRKLSVAMTLIGEPEVVFLDEPTSGVDPVSRRKLWRVLNLCQRSGRSIVLTSHSMEECEVLCKRITIMVKGQMKCIGTIQYLKNKFSQGFTVQIRLLATDEYYIDVTQVKFAMEETFKNNCILKDEHPGLLHYHITNAKLKWSFMFNKMEEMKDNFKIIEDYTISETTLEQLFLSFAREEI